MAVACPPTSTLHPDWVHRLQILGAGKPPEIMVDQIRAISLERLGKKIDLLAAADSAALRKLIAGLYATP